MQATTSKNLTKKVSNKSVDNEDDEWENHLIIRFPKEIAEKVEEFVDEEAPMVFF